MKFIIILSLLISFSSAMDCQLNGDCAVLWQHANCEGTRLGINPSNANVGSGFNDRASSVFVRGGCRVTLFDDNDFRGSAATYPAGYHMLRSFNDRTTSARCMCP